MGSIMQYDMYLAAERVLLWTAAFSLAVSILIEGFLMFATRKNNNQSTKRWLRRALLSILLLNSLLSFGCLAFFTVAQAISRRCEGLLMIENGYQADHAIYSAADGNASLHRSWIFKQRKRVVPWELSCLAIFVFSIILLVSAWLDFRDDKSWPAEDDRENFGEKGEIYL